MLRTQARSDAEGPFRILLWFAFHMSHGELDVRPVHGIRGAHRLLLGTVVVASLIASAPPVLAARPGIDETSVKVAAGAADATTGSVRVRLSVREAGKVQFTVPPKTPRGSITGRTPSRRSTTTAFTYRPTPSARHQAARLSATAADKVDTFAVTVTDGYGGSVTVPVSLRVSPQNAAPIAAPVVGVPNAVGVVTGNVGVTDPDGDSLSYAVTTPPVRGSVAVASDGSFTYTPNGRAVRHRTAVEEATDTFTVTVSDGYGGSIGVPITCPAHG